MSLSTAGDTRGEIQWPESHPHAVTRTPRADTWWLDLLQWIFSVGSAPMDLLSQIYSDGSSPEDLLRRIFSVGSSLADHFQQPFSSLAALNLITSTPSWNTSSVASPSALDRIKNLFITSLVHMTYLLQLEGEC